MLRNEDRPTYAEAVWDTFRAKHQPDRLMMSNTEFKLVERWMDRDVPLFVVLMALEEFTGRARRLEALEGPVEKVYAYYRQAMAL